MDELMFVHMEREYNILMTLNGHPNIVQAYDHVSEIEHFRGYLVLEKI